MIVELTATSDNSDDIIITFVVNDRDNITLKDLYDIFRKLFKNEYKLKLKELVKKVRKEKITVK